MSLPYLADRSGVVDYSDRKFEESLYLLDETYRVIGMRRATKATGPAPECGDAFFAHYPIAPKERSCLNSACSLLNLRPLLFRAGNRPMLALFECFPHTHMILIVVPERQLRRCFDRPATHASETQWLHAFQFLLSPATLTRHQPITPESYEMMHGWIAGIYNALHYRVDEREFDHLVASIAVRLSLQAKLLGLRLSLDLSDLSYDLRDTHELALILPHALATMIAAKRLARDSTIHMQAEYVIGIGPTVMADFYTAEPQERIPELEPLRALAMQRGDTFDYMSPATDPCHVAVQFSLRPACISAQELKTDPPFENNLPVSIWTPYYIGPAEWKNIGSWAPNPKRDFLFSKL